ncbi:hypothetical protein K458DRAFT_462486 [Lentithecium fluviatile CBS 122367]|uniref:SRR1-like domain-containing protein n=1 Tax=Lentithecium fluviatile CBS 122367 TaxID=1168545 RepID=A0A6G1JGU6_9PLEO|nr:hypothetical protein K458DRAFT_462486 [Lentithecium fluviatile CBS 122367]
MPFDKARSRIYTRARMEALKGLVDTAQRPYDEVPPQNLAIAEWTSTVDVEQHLKSMGEEDLEEADTSIAVGFWNEAIADWNNSSEKQKMDDVNIGELFKDSRDIDRVFSFGLGSMAASDEKTYLKHIAVRYIVEKIMESRNVNRVDVWFCDAEYRKKDKDFLRKYMPINGNGIEWDDIQVIHDVDGFLEIDEHTMIVDDMTFDADEGPVGIVCLPSGKFDGKDACTKNVEDYLKDFSAKLFADSTRLGHSSLRLKVEG